MTDNEIRHSILELIANSLANNNNIVNVTTPVSRVSVRDYKPDTGLKRSTAIKFLVATGNLKHFVDQNNDQLYITQKGINSLNEEYFLHQYRKEYRETLNNRYTIAFGVITALGVLFAILKDTLWNEGTGKQEMRIIIQQQTKTLPVVSDSITTIVVAIPVDSSKAFDTTIKNN